MECVFDLVKKNERARERAEILMSDLLHRFIFKFICLSSRILMLKFENVMVNMFVTCDPSEGVKMSSA